MLHINSEVAESLPNFSHKFAATAQTSIVWFIGYDHVSQLKVTNQNNLAASLEGDLPFVRSLIPAGLDIVGFFFHSEQVVGSEEIFLNAFLQNHHKNLMPFFSKNKELVLSTIKKTIQMTEVDEVSEHFDFFLHTSLVNAQITPITAENMKSIPPADLCNMMKQDYFVLRTNLDLNFSFVCVSEEFSKQLFSTVQPIVDSIKSGDFLLSIQAPVQQGKSKQTSSSTMTGKKLAKGNLSCGELFDSVGVDQTTEWVDSTAMVPISPFNSDNKPATLSYTQPIGSLKYCQESLKASVLYYIKRKDTGHTFEEFYETLSHHLFYQCQYFCKVIAETGPSISPTTFHFLPSRFPHIITSIYPIDESVTTIPNTNIPENEDHLHSVRQGYHKALMLPMDRPLLRCNNQLHFDISSPTFAPPTNILEDDYRLKNVHLQLEQDQGTSKGTKYLVQGNYLYYHYEQDLNDSGWGCAYRSLQTICSWMVLQGYTTKTVPTHREIQQILIDLQDKEKNFLGSNQWIGAPEVFLCLDHLYGVSSKIINVNSGAEIAQKGRELSQHFRTEGTPIMIGGGVLAYTLLGVDCDENSGNIKFLILDPHYVGAENLKAIKDKWCGWKGPDLFRKDAFYNLCLPLRPRKV